jgi:probable HAF family extracellular repeat protein
VATVGQFTLDSEFSRGFGINNAGDVAGSMKDADGNTVAFQLSKGGLWNSDEAVMPNGLPEVRFAINDRGDVAGHKAVTGGILPVVWKKGLMYDLKVLPGYSYGEVYDINASGQMVGESLNGNFVAPPQARATVFSVNKPPVDLGTLGGSIASAAGNNDRGDVVGFAETSIPGQMHAFVYTNGTMYDLGTLGGAFSNANAINNRGEIVGRSALPNGAIRGFYCQALGTPLINLGTLGGNSSVAVDINDRGSIVGFSRIGTGQFHAFLYENGTMTDIGALIAGTTDSRAMQINNNGDITGYYTSTDGSVHAFLYRNGVMYPL